MVRARVAFLSPAIFVFLGCASNGSEHVEATEKTTPATGPTACDGRQLMMGISASVRACCQLGTDTWFISPKTGGITHMVVSGRNCSTEDGGIDCAGHQCFYGPCNGAVPLSVDGGPPAYVFHPVSNPAVCGTQAAGAGFFPEPYSNQEVYPPAETRCPWTECAGGGLPGVDLTVKAVAKGATGHVSSKPAGIDLEGASDGGTAIFTQLEVKLMAKALGPHARVQFSGDCSDTTRVGQTVQCKLTLGPNKEVTVTYLCDPGWTCQH
jgi:hypothetical protein